MAANMIKMDNPIYDVAVECERLFEAQIARFKRADDGNGAALIAEVSHQFSAWATSLRVFADGDLSLDRKLQCHAEIQDQVLRGLDLMQANLAYVHMDDASPGREASEDSSLNQPPRLSIENVEVVSEALKRLHEIGMIIRQSSTMSHARRAREHTEGLDFTSFTQLASLSLQSLFSTASAELREQLTFSMTDTYRLFLYRRGKVEPQEKKQKHKTAWLYTIPEDSAGEETPGKAVRDSDSGEFTMVAKSSPASQVPQDRPIAPQSRPTTIDTREASSRLGRLHGPSAKRSTASILVSHVDYPKPTSGNNTCDWCFSPLPKDVFQGDKWQQHVNEDHRPFICISEKCMKASSLPRFATARKWLQHMLETHGSEWHRVVHAPSQWICPLCRDTTVKCPSPDDLKKHLDDDHNNSAFTDSQKLVIVRQSRASCLRPRNECPICGLSIQDQEDSPQDTINAHEKSKRNASDDIASSENDKKRLKTQAGDRTSALPIRGSGSQGSSSTTRLAPEVIARHIAGHLRTIMLLTLRIISIDGPVEVSSDRESVSGKTDDQLSRIASSQRNLDQDEVVTWDYIRSEDDAAIDDFLHQAVEQGAFQSHLSEKTAADAPQADTNMERKTEEQPELTPQKAEQTSGWFSAKTAANLWEPFRSLFQPSGQIAPQPKQTLPKPEEDSLDDEGACHVAWQAFERLPQHKQRLALRAFQWTLCSYEPMNTQELSMAMLIDPHSDEVDELGGEDERLLRIGGIGGLCGSLLNYDVQRDIWHFRHPSAAEYLKEKECNIDEASTFVAMACLKFLTTDPCAAGKTKCECGGTAAPSFQPSTKQPLCSFIRAYTIGYVQKAENYPTCHDARLTVLEKRFLGSPQSSSPAYQTWAKTWGETALENGNYLKPVSSPLFCMAAFGLHRLLLDWWTDPRTNLNLCNDQGNSLLDLTDIYSHDAIRQLITSHNLTFSPLESDPPTMLAQDNYSRSDLTPERPPPTNVRTPRRPSARGRARSSFRGRGTSNRSRRGQDSLSFLFVVNKLLIAEPEQDSYRNFVPSHSPYGYSGEVPSTVMRYSDGDVSEAVGYQWYRDPEAPEGHLFRYDEERNWVMDTSSGGNWVATEYKRRAVFACNPLLPIMTSNHDPLLDVSHWELLEVHHPREARIGLSQIVTSDSPVEWHAGSRLRYVAGKTPSWMPALVPNSYRNPYSYAPESRGLGGELAIILGLMALNERPKGPTENEANDVFLQQRQWRRHEWRTNQHPQGHPATAQDVPNGFLSAIFLDPDNPLSTEEALHRFEWQTAIVGG
ncbi:hypothetical protein CDV31_001697 [Fusarium ambrosium]|uniref:C2H2-type domain-containing protein n=1 Tax=Fusarium ambrosium TaxID=131363 RepID=A0A428UZ74_9HYPO|nr:hypothetical protein CDV31_001697 [Fusarium ambrosium]